MSSGALSAQSPTRKGSLSMEVRAVSSGGTTRSSHNLYARKPDDEPHSYRPRYSYYSSVRSRGSHVGLQIEIRNLGRQDHEAVLEWFFIGKSAGGDGIFVFDQGSKVVAVPSAHRELVELKSKEITSMIERKRSRYTFWDESDGSRRYSGVRLSGYKASGWIVRLTSGGQLLEARASSPSLETIARDESQLRRLPRGASD